MFVALLGRQAELSVAELMAVFGAARVQQRSPLCASIQTDVMTIDHLGGTLKCAELISELPAPPGDKACLLAASRFIIDHYARQWRHPRGKRTLGVSAYGLQVAARDVHKTGLLLKSRLTSTGTSLRLIPNGQPALSTATAHHNKLGRAVNKVEILIIRAGQRLLIAESRGAQNITAYTRRDRQRPRRDAFVGMLPPKLAQIMLNLALGPRLQADHDRPLHVLDPFCGTGTVLQEALLRGCVVSGSDLSPKMIDYTRQNLAWLRATHHTTGEIRYLQPGDATTLQWPTPHSIDAVVCETYLGQPFSAPPAAAKLAEVTTHCSHIISRFLANLRPQLAPGTPLCIAVPAWADQQDRLTQLPLIKQLDALGYHVTHAAPLIYRRPGQVVARQLLMLRSA